MVHSFYELFYPPANLGFAELLVKTQHLHTQRENLITTGTVRIFGFRLPQFRALETVLISNPQLFVCLFSFHVGASNYAIFSSKIESIKETIK